MFSVSEASRICENPTEADYKNLMNIIQYLKGTKNKSIHYNKNNKLTYLLTLYEDDILIGIKNKINYTLHYNINKLIEIYNF